MIRSVTATLLIAALGSVVFAQTPKRQTANPPATPAKPSSSNPTDAQADAYYNFAMGRLYAEMAGEQSSREMANRAVKYYEQALKDAPNVPIIADELTDLYVGLRRLQDAVALGEDLLKKDPDNLNARRILGKVYVKMAQSGRGDDDAVQKAIEQYQKITQKEPSDVDSWTTLGDLYRATNNSAEAEKAYKAGLAADPGNADALRSLAKLYMDNGDTKNALEKLQAAADKDPSEEVLFDLGVAYAQSGKHQEAIDALQKVMEAAPDNERTARLLAGEYTRVVPPRLDDARKLYERLEAADRRESTYPLALSEIYRDQKNLPKAREAADRAKKLAPDDLDVRLNDASLLFAEGKPDDATLVLKGVVEDANRAPSTDDKRGEKLAYLQQVAAIYETNKRWSDAAQTLDVAEKASVTDIEKAKICFARGDMLERQKQHEAAEKEFRKVLQLNPKDAEAMNYLGYMLADRNVKLDEASQLVKKALDMVPDNGAFLDSLGWIYYRQGKYSEAQGLLERALTQTPDPTIHDHLGDVLSKQGKTKEAVSEWQAALKLAKQPGQADVDEEEMARVSKKLDEAEAKLAKEGH